MCLYINHRKNKGLFIHRPTIATKPIIVYKFILEQNNFLYSLPRYYCYGRYQPLLSIEEPRLAKYAINSVSIGIHSYVRRIISYPSSSLYYCIIPIGAKYYVGIHNDIVSDKLIIFKDLDELIKAYPNSSQLII